MSGSLYHAQEFITKEYLGGDGRIHHEVVCVDGDCTSLGHSTWRAMVDLAEAHGMPRSTWPEFLTHDFGIDVPLEDVRVRQSAFRDHIMRLPRSALDRHRWLACVAEWVRRGESVFFCGN